MEPRETRGNRGRNRRNNRGRGNSRQPNGVLKRKLRTCEDIMTRLKWDPDLGIDLNDVMVVYRDGKDGVAFKSEIPLPEFRPIKEGGDIPEHRILHLRYRDIRLWDKELRLDRISGSGDTEPSQRWNPNGPPPAPVTRSATRSAPSSAPTRPTRSNQSEPLPPLQDGPVIPPSRPRRMDESRKTHISKQLSTILRHTALKLGLTVYSDGYVSLTDILNTKMMRESNPTMDEIFNVVDTNSKKRFSIVNKIEANGHIGLYIRANQGHSKKLKNMVNDDLLLTRITPEMVGNFPQVVHGTYYDALAPIQRTGLNRMRRQHIHFTTSTNLEEVTSGFRGSTECLIFVDLHKCISDGIPFFVSQNNVLLSPGIDGIIPSKYFIRIVDRKRGNRIIWSADGRSRGIHGQESEGDFAQIVEEYNLASENPLIDICANLSRYPRKDISEMVHRAKIMNVRHMVIAGLDLNQSVDAAKICRLHPGVMKCGIGVHPHDAARPFGKRGSRHRQGEIDIQHEMRQIIEKYRDVIGCIGECGLDFNRNLSPPDEQRRVFELQVELAVELGLPLLCHEREAHDAFIEIIGKFCETDEDGNRTLPIQVLIHCFTGTQEEANEYISMGCYLGLTTFISQSRTQKGDKAQSIRNVRNLLKSDGIPLDRIMLETDAPFQKPHFDEADGNENYALIENFLRSSGKHKNGRPRVENEPCLTVCALNTLHALSEGRHSKAEIARQTTQNAMQFFGFGD